MSACEVCERRDCRELTHRPCPQSKYSDTHHFVRGNFLTKKSAPLRCVICGMSRGEIGALMLIESQDG